MFSRDDMSVRGATVALLTIAIQEEGTRTLAVDRAHQRMPGISALMLSAPTDAKLRRVRSAEATPSLAGALAASQLSKMEPRARAFIGEFCASPGPSR
jgi:hypothetical protein